MSCDPVRRRALDVLLAVDGGEHLDPLLDRALNETRARRDAAFLAELVRGTLQWRGRYDHVIAHFSRKRPPTDPVLVNILRLTLHQLLSLDSVPAYAAIHQAGELCRHTAGRGKVGFVNGLLQAARRELLGEANASQGREQALAKLFAAFANDRPRWLAAWHSLPPWLVDRWVRRFGIAQASALCAWTNAPVATHLHVLGDHTAAAASAALADAGIANQPATIPAALTLTERAGRSQLRACLEQLPYLVVQDTTVQRATRWLTEGLPHEKPILDMCAAPGGKTAWLRAALPQSTLIVAADNRSVRLHLLRDTLERVAPGRVPQVLADGKHPPFAPGSFGGILLDGPCSGTGVLRHHPEARWRLQAKAPGQLAGTLLELGRQAADLLAPGGRLLYATCSLEPEENEEVLEALLASRTDLKPAPDAQGRWQRLWLPHEVCGDGFFAARLVKTT
jgi:16S rRNA (cytosine967-C5)-methyltransferase